MTINQTAEFDSAIGYARKIETAILDKPKAQEPVAWCIKFRTKEHPDFLSVHYHGTNAIADYRTIDPDAICEPLYTHPIQADDVVRDAARYRFLRDEAYLVNPVVAVVWKKNDDREESEWVNTVDGYSLDYHIDKAMGETK